MLTWDMISEPGRRKENEDAVRVCEDKNAWLFVLADGLGGCGHGSIASAVAVESAVDSFRRGSIEKDGFLAAGIEAAQDAVLARKQQDPGLRRMGTTLVMLKICGGFAEWVHVGDSRLYLFRKNRVFCQTLDHSVAQMLVNLGEISPEEIRHHPDRNRLIYTVGADWVSTPYVLSGKVWLRKGDAFLLCTDGFWEYLEESRMCQALKKARTVTEWRKDMTAVVEENGRGIDMDNYSAICVRI